VGAAAIAGLLASGAADAATTTTTTSPPAGGTVQVFAKPGTGAVGVIVITGAIGDQGRTVSINQNGKTDLHGNYVRIALTKGSFEGSGVGLAEAEQHPRTSFNTTTCSGFISVTGPVTLLDGTGLYKGIAGTLTITETSAYILPRYTSGSKKGQCNETKSAKPSAVFAITVGSGSVTFG